MADIELKNDTKLEFIDISSEKWRMYKFPSGIVSIHEPQWLAVKRPRRHYGGGSHRIVDKEGISYYIPNGWISIQWEAKEGKPHFIK